MVKKTKQKVLILILAALGVVGLGVYILAGTSEEPVQNLVSDVNPVGVDTTPYDGSWRFTSTSDKFDELGSIVTEIDKDGNYRAINDKIISVTVGETTYTRLVSNENSWQQSSDGLYNPSDALKEIFLEEFLYEGIQIEYQGDGDCLVGTCRIYKITDLNKEKKLGEVSTRTASISEGEVKIDTKTNRPSEHIVTHTRATPSETTYETITTVFEFGVDFEKIELPEGYSQ